MQTLNILSTQKLRWPCAFGRQLGDSFKWLFYTDDDTMFFLDAAVNVVKDLDPDMPYFLTGFLFSQLLMLSSWPQHICPQKLRMHCCLCDRTHNLEMKRCQDHPSWHVCGVYLQLYRCEA